jgi:hypothetical protein
MPYRVSERSYYMVIIIIIIIILNINIQLLMRITFQIAAPYISSGHRLPVLDYDRHLTASYI